jgi:hypothetical protein
MILPDWTSTPTTVLPEENKQSAEVKASRRRRDWIVSASTCQLRRKQMPRKYGLAIANEAVSAANQEWFAAGVALLISQRNR